MKSWRLSDRYRALKHVKTTANLQVYMSFITDRLQDKKIGTEYDLLKETCQIHQRI